MTRRPGIPPAAPVADASPPSLISPSLFHLWQEGHAGEPKPSLQPSVRFRKTWMRFNGEAKAESLSLSCSWPQIPSGDW